VQKRGSSFALKGKLLRCFCEAFLDFLLAADADRPGQRDSLRRNL